MTKFVSALAAMAIGLSMVPGTAAAQRGVYNATTLPAAPQAGSVHYLQLLTPSPDSVFTLRQFQLGVNWSSVGRDQGVLVAFYNGIDPSTGSRDALANATQLLSVSGLLGTPDTPGNYTYLFTLNTPQTIAPGSNFGVEFTLTDEFFAFMADEVNGRFTAASPTVGTSPGYVWNDADSNGVFTGAEQTRFGQNAANVRFSINAAPDVTPTPTPAPPVPEPATWSLMILGAGLVGMMLRRSRSGRRAMA